MSLINSHFDHPAREAVIHTSVHPRRRIRAEGSGIKSRCGQSLGGYLVAGGHARTPSERHRGTLDQCPIPPYANIEPCKELDTQPGVYPALPLCSWHWPQHPPTHTPHIPKWDKAVKKKRKKRKKKNKLSENTLRSIVFSCQSI